MDSHIFSQFLEIINSIKEKPQMEEMLNRLGICIADNNNHTVFSHGIWQSLGIVSFISQEWITQIHSEDIKNVQSHQKALHNGKIDSFKLVYRIHDAENKWHWISENRQILQRDMNGNPVIEIGIAEDITVFKEAQEKAEKCAQEAITLNAVVAHANSSLNLDETVQTILKHIHRLIPYESVIIQILHNKIMEPLGGRGFLNEEIWQSLHCPYPDRNTPSTRTIQERKPWISANYTLDFPHCEVLTANGPAQSWLGVPLIAYGDIIGLIGFFNSIPDFFTSHHLSLASEFAGPIAIALENARMHGETYKLAMEDSLTGLGSRHSFNLNSQYLFEKSKREDRQMSVAMLDLDYFKKINDTFGHLVGDAVLKKICETCVQALRKTDIIARYGGEEIIILFPDTTLNTALRIMERICKTVAELEHDGVNRPVTLSGGISGINDSKEVSLNEIIREADMALYQAKNSGRNRIVVYKR